MALCTVASTAQAQTIGSQEHGHSLAQAQCAECHAIERGQDRSPNPAAPTFERLANISGMTSSALTVALRTSHRTMPNVIIDSNDTSDLVAYILSLTKGGHD